MESTVLKKNTVDEENKLSHIKKNNNRITNSKVVAPVLKVGTCHKPEIQELCENLKPKRNSRSLNTGVE